MNNRIMATLFALALCLCLFIGVVPVEADAAHTHKSDGTTYYNEVKHWQKCVTASCSATYNETNHTLSKPTVIVAPDMYSTDTHHKVTCSKCGYVAYSTHNWYLPETTDTTHTYTCKDCGKVVTAAHVDGNDDCVCDTYNCGYKIPHNYKKVIVDANYHEDKCSCNEVKENSRVKHNFTWETTTEKHVGTCSECGYKQSATADHDFKYVDNKDGTHTRTCETCGYSDTVDHVDGKTKDCKCTNCKAQMEHTYDGWQENETVHSHYCTVCQKYVDEAKHEFEYTPAPYGTDKHKKICKVCGYVETTADCVDKDDDHYCDECGGLRNHNGAESSMIIHHKTMTCEDDGIWLHHECPTCHELFRNGQVVTGQDMTNPAKGHNLVWAKAQETGHYQYCKNDTCKYHTDEEKHSFTYEYKDDGTHDRTCTVCGYKDNKGCSIDENCTCVCGHVMNHKPDQAKMVLTKKKAPDCENEGNKAYYTCADCGRIFIKNATDTVYTVSDVGDPYLAPLGHKWVHQEDTLSGMHLVKCQRTRCGVFESIPHTSSTGGCTCDVKVNGVACGKLVHSHDAVKVERKAPTCQEAGYEAYWKYEACGRMFKDDFAHTEIKAPIAIAKVACEAGAWVNEGDNHVKHCVNCNEAVDSGAHVDANGDNRCDVCNFELALEYVAEVPATCTTSGTKAHYISRVTQRKYWDAEGTKYISNTGDLVIKAYAHIDPVTGVGPIASDKGNGTHEYVCQLCNNVTKTEAHTTGGCFCTVCGAGASASHVATTYPYQAPVCDKDGHEAYAQCSCGKFYNAQGVETTYQALTLKATGHKWGAEVFNDDAAGKHYAVCEICRAKNYGEHEVTASDPLSGNYHQFVCECGEVSLEAHYDKNGDNVCDEAGCKRDLSNKEVTVNNNPSTTVVTGDKNTVNSAWSWLKNWLNNTTGSNAGGSTTPTQTAQPGTATGSQGSTAGNGATTTTPAAGSNTGSTGAGSNATYTPSNQGGNQTADATGVLQAIISFFNWIISGFGG